MVFQSVGLMAFCNVISLVCKYKVSIKITQYSRHYVMFFIPWYDEECGGQTKPSTSYEILH